jgi:tetratricopeptide (TPR) repeat protein
LVAVGGAISPSVAAVLEPQETVLLARLAEAVTVGELLRQAASGGGGSSLRRLCRLRSVGLIRFRREPAAVQKGALVPADVLQQFADRVERELVQLPLDLEPDAQRARLGDLLARAGGMTHYELLGIRAEANADEIYEAYVRLARLVHPSHSERLHLAGREATLWLLFERATDAYLTLSHPERRARYEAKVGLAHDPQPTQEAREREAEGLARGYYRRALELIEQQDFHFAVELLRQAVQAHPLPEYYLRLAETQAKNPHWTRQAADSYRKAIELGGDEPWARVALGQLCETMERYEEARRHYEQALAKMPGEPEALAGLARISALVAPEPRRRGLFGFLRRG